MPTTEGTHAEDLAIEAVCRQLRASGHEVCLIARPDREPLSLIRVDAVLNVDGQLLALDHFGLGRPDDQDGAAALVRRVLSKKLDGQLADARRIACCHVGVVLDQRATDQRATPLVISPALIEEIVAGVVADRPGMLDVAWTLDVHGSIRTVFGCWPP